MCRRLDYPGHPELPVRVLEARAARNGWAVYRKPGAEDVHLCEDCDLRHRTPDDWERVQL